MYSMLKDFAGPFATVVAAAAASFLVFYFNRGQLRIAEQRLVLDVFDRRWAIVDELRSAISEVIRDGAVPSEAYKRYVRASLRSAFLFGPEVTDYLETVRVDLTRLIAVRGPLGSDSDERRAKAADAEAEIFMRITQFYENHDALIRPYMAMHQKLPD